MQAEFNEHLPWSHRLETGPAECAERLNNDYHNNNHIKNNNDNIQFCLQQLIPTRLRQAACSPALTDRAIVLLQPV